MSIRTLAVSLFLAACTPAPWPGELASDTATTSTGGPAPASTAGASSTTTDDPSTGTTTSTGTTGPFNFISVPDGGWGAHYDCDPWLQNCPFGQKCMPYSSDGDNSWDSLKCVTVVPDPDQVGDPCTVTGSPASGEDTCDIHMMCWAVDPDTLTGTCVAMCIGSPEMPTCADPATYCTLAGDGVLLPCLPNCDPLAQDCPEGDLCIPNLDYPERWVCFLDASGDAGQAFDPCEYVNACDKGLMCLNPTLGDECDPQAIGCCLPFCDTSLPNTCPGQGLECLPWYEAGQAPPGFENVGVCGLPAP